MSKARSIAVKYDTTPCNGAICFGRLGGRAKFTRACKRARLHARAREIVLARPPSLPKKISIYGESTPVRRSLQQTVGESSQGKTNFLKLWIDENRFKYKLPDTIHITHVYGVPKNITLKYTLMGVCGPSMDHILVIALGLAREHPFSVRETSSWGGLPLKNFLSVR